MHPYRSLVRRSIAASLAVAFLASSTLGIGGGSTAAAAPVGLLAQDRPSLAGGIDWINTDRPIHLDKLRGKIVLLDFWTYCCINCHHIIPTLAKLEEKYKNQLVVVGVHSAKFDAEKLTSNIRKKVREYNIRHPVVNDANMTIWRNFGVESWPTLVLIGPDGIVLKKQGGEVTYEVLDRIIGELVLNAKSAGILDETPVQFFSEREKAHSGGLLFPGKVTADKAGNRLFISDTGHNRIVVTDLAGKFQEAIGGGSEGLADGTYGKAMLNRPQGTCLVGETLYVADTENHAIRSVDLRAKTVTTVAGNGRQADFGSRGGKGTKSSLNSPWDLVPIPNTRTLAVAMAGPHQIWHFDFVTEDARPWAGTGREDIHDGNAVSAAFAQPSGIATDGQHLFVADSEGSCVRSIMLAGRSHPVTTLVGTHDLARGQSLFAFGDLEGVGAEARLQHCLGVAFAGGKLYVADSYNNRIKVCDPATKTLKALVGSTNPGATDTPPLFDEPGGLSVAGDTLYVADTNNHAIRAVSLASKEVKTLALEGVNAPSQKQPPRFPSPTVVDVSPVKAGLGDSPSLAITLKLPPGYDLNSQASMVYLVETPENPAALSDKNPATGGKIDPPSETITIPVPLSKAAKAGESLTVRVSLKAMVCLPNTLCTVKNFVWNVPITFAADAPGTVKIGGR